MSDNTTGERRERPENAERDAGKGDDRGGVRAGIVGRFERTTLRTSPKCDGSIWRCACGHLFEANEQERLKCRACKNVEIVLSPPIASPALNPGVVCEVDLLSKSTAIPKWAERFELPTEEEGERYAGALFCESCGARVLIQRGRSFPHSCPKCNPHEFVGKGDPVFRYRDKLPAWGHRFERVSGFPTIANKRRSAVVICSLCQRRVAIVDVLNPPSACASCGFDGDLSKAVDPPSHVVKAPDPRWEKFDEVVDAIETAVGVCQKEGEKLSKLISEKLGRVADPQEPGLKCSKCGETAPIAIVEVIGPNETLCRTCLISEVNRLRDENHRAAGEALRESSKKASALAVLDAIVGVADVYKREGTSLGFALDGQISVGRKLLAEIREKEERDG